MNDTNTTKLSSTDQAWDSGALGASAEHAVAAPAELGAAIEASLGLQVVSTQCATMTSEEPQR